MGKLVHVFEQKHLTHVVLMFRSSQVFFSIQWHDFRSTVFRWFNEEQKLIMLQNSGKHRNGNMGTKRFFTKASVSHQSVRLQPLVSEWNFSAKFVRNFYQYFNSGYLLEKV